MIRLKTVLIELMRVYIYLERMYRSFLISTWQSSKLDSGRKADFWSKLRRFFDYCSDRPEFNLELVPSQDQDILVAKYKGRQRASKSRMNFHIGGPHIQCIFVMCHTLLVIIMKYESYKMTHIYNKEGNNKRGIHESLNWYKFWTEKQGSTDRRFAKNF